jgi:hypothetical protein
MALSTHPIPEPGSTSEPSYTKLQTTDLTWYTEDVEGQLPPEVRNLFPHTTFHSPYLNLPRTGPPHLRNIQRHPARPRHHTYPQRPQEVMGYPRIPLYRSLRFPRPVDTVPFYITSHYRGFAASRRREPEGTTQGTRCGNVHLSRPARPAFRRHPAVLTVRVGYHILCRLGLGAFQ